MGAKAVKSGAGRARVGGKLNYLYVPLGILALWQLISFAGFYPRGLVPPPVQVFSVWYDLITGWDKSAGPYTGVWFRHALASLFRVYAGFAIAITLGILLGLLIGLSRRVERLLDPTVQLLRNIPVTAWLPLSIVFFGIADRPAIFLIALGAFFPTVVNTAHGVRHVEQILVKAGLMMGANRYQLLRNIIFPAALPSILTGNRLSMGIAWVLVVVAEMVAVKSGLGYLLMDARLFFRYDILIASMLSIGLLGFLSDVLIILVRNRILAWTRLVSYGG